jgi:hypothetical protein
VKLQEMSDILGRVADKMGSRDSRIPVGIPVLLQQSHCDKGIQQESQRLPMDTETIRQVVEGFPLPIQGRKHIQLNGCEQNFGLPVVPKLEDFCE